MEVMTLPLRLGLQGGLHHQPRCRQNPQNLVVSQPATQALIISFLPPWRTKHHGQLCPPPVWPYPSPLSHLSSHLSPTVSWFVAAVPPSHISSFLRDIYSLQAAVRGGHVSNRRTVSLYSQWSYFCSNLHLDHLLKEPDIPDIKILQVYIYQVNNGGFSSRAFLLQLDSVAMAWQAISETRLLEGCR